MMMISVDIGHNIRTNNGLMMISVDIGHNIRTNNGLMMIFVDIGQNIRKQWSNDDIIQLLTNEALDMM